MTAVSTSQNAKHEPAIEGCLEACARCRVLVDVTTAPDAPPQAYAAIGPHLRHCLDHFVLFFRGVDAGEVDYDARDRDERLERDSGHFLSILTEIEGRLRGLEPADVGRGMVVRQEAASGGRARTVETTVERELMFLSSHTIHHIAIMSLIAGRAGVEVPERLGIAFSTESYTERQATETT